MIMAQLPPKVPNVMHNDYHNQQWEGFLQQAQNQSTPWVDEFMEFSAIRRGTHRRTMSDSSVAFLEAGPPMPCVSGCGSFRLPEVNDGCKTNNDDQYDRFDDEQLIMSMFGSELGRCHSNPSSTSDHNSTNEVLITTTTTKEDEEKEEEAESPSKSKKAKGKGQVQGQGGGEGSHSKGGNVAAEVDPKRVKRILANRQSAQRSRVRKLQYISELERSVTALQSEVSALSPRVAFLDHQRMILNGDNSTLKAKIAALAQDKIFKDAHQEAMKREIERLRQVYYQQNINNTENIIQPPSSSSLQQINPSQQPDNTVHENKQLNG